MFMVLITGEELLCIYIGEFPHALYHYYGIW